MSQRQKNRLGRVVDRVKRTSMGSSGRMSQARDRVGPAVEEAWERMGPSLDQARERAATALLSAMEASEPLREEARKRRRAAMMALRGELRAPEPRQRHWMRNLALAGGAGGLAFVGYRLLRDGHAPWQGETSPGRSAAQREAEPTSPAPRGARTPGEEPQAPPPGLS